MKLTPETEGRGPMKITHRLRGRAASLVCGPSRPRRTSGETRSLGEWLRACLRSGNEGQSIVESALVFPFLLMVIFGILLSGIAVFNWITLNQAVSSGLSDLQSAQAAGMIVSTAASPYSDPCTLITTKVASYAYTMNPANITYNIYINNTLIFPSQAGVSQYSGVGTLSCTSAPALTDGSYATVVATYPCNLIILGVNNTCNMNATSTVRIVSNVKGV